MSAVHAERTLASLKRAKSKGLTSEVKLIRKTEGEYNYDTGETDSTVTEYVGIGLKDNYRQKDIDGTLIKQGDMMLYVDALNMPRPVTGEVIIVGDSQFTVVNVNPLAPGDTDILYILQVRGL